MNKEERIQNHNLHLMPDVNSCELQVGSAIYIQNCIAGREITILPANRTVRPEEAWKAIYEDCNFRHFRNVYCNFDFCWKSDMFSVTDVTDRKASCTLLHFSCL